MGKLSYRGGGPAFRHREYSSLDATLSLLSEEGDFTCKRLDINKYCGGIMEDLRLY